MLSQIIKDIKDIAGFRFYFLTCLLFLMFVIITFKDEIKQFKFNPSELTEIKDQDGLLNSVQSVKEKHKLINGFVVFIYQPTSNSYYKRLVATNISFIEKNDYFKAMPLNTQKYLNYMLINREYVLLSYENNQDVDYINTYASDYVYVYNIYVKETIGEIIFTFDVRPTEAELNIITKELRQIKFYII